MLHVLTVDAHIDERIKEFNQRLSRNEKVVNLVATEKHVYITTEEKSNREYGARNLLQEKFQNKLR